MVYTPHFSITEEEAAAIRSHVASALAEDAERGEKQPLVPKQRPETDLSDPYAEGRTCSPTAVLFLILFAGSGLITLLFFLIVKDIFHLKY